MSPPSVTRQRLNDGHFSTSLLRLHAVSEWPILVVMIGLTFSLLLAGCTTTPLESDENEGLQAQALTIQPVSALVIGIGRQLQFRAIPTMASGEPAAGYTISWTTSDETVATITQSGLVTAVAEGTTTIEATANGQGGGNPGKGKDTAPGQLKKSATITVDSAQVASVEVDPGSAELDVGGGLTLKATVKDQDGNVLEGRYVVWSTSDEAVATVDNSGSVTGESDGQATVVAESEGQSGSSSISVATDSPPPPPSGNLIPAFPGAEGHGATAFNECRSLPLQVLFVTNTNSSGSGSLEQALLDARSDRFTLVIFRTGGSTQGVHRIKSSCLYIAGQTAPGDGFSINRSSGAGVLEVYYKEGLRRDVVVRYIRLRSAESETCGSSTLRVLGGQRLVFDHLSLAYACDSFFATTPLAGWDSLTDLTLQNSILCGGLPKSGTALELSVNETDEPLTRLSLAKNYTCHYGHRAPRFNNEGTSGTQVKMSAEFVSNLTYNWWGSRAGSVQGGADADFIANYFVAGPAASNPNELSYLRFIEYDQATGTRFDPMGSVYMRGNRNLGGSATYTDYDLFHVYRSWETPLPDHLRRSTPISAPMFPVTAIDDASTLPDRLLPTVGVSQLLTCDGDWRTTNVRDALDGRFVADFHNGTGPTDRPSSTSDYGGYPTLDSGAPCTDTDRDGMPDAFETRYGLDPNSAGDAGVDSDGDGYLNIEEYVNGTSPR